MAAIFLRTVMLYLLLVAVFRLSGKKQIGELDLPELCVTLLISEVASLPLTNADVPLMYAVVPIMTLISLEISSSFLMTKIPGLKRLFGGQPLFVITGGNIDKEALLRSRLSLDELLSELRILAISDISDVEYAILEPNGKLSVFKKADKEQPTCADMNVAGQSSGIAHELIIDGQTAVYGLQSSGKSEKWLSDQLNRRRLKTSDVFLMTVDDKDKITVIRKGRV